MATDNLNNADFGGYRILMNCVTTTTLYFVVDPWYTVASDYFLSLEEAVEARRSLLEDEL